MGATALDYAPLGVVSGVSGARGPVELFLYPNGLAIAEPAGRPARWVPLEELSDVRLTSATSGSALTVRYRDGRVESFGWRRSFSGHGAVARLLSAAVGEKLRLG